MNPIDLSQLEVVCPLRPNEVFTDRGIENRYLVSIERMVSHVAFLSTILRRLSNFQRSCEDRRFGEERKQRSLQLLWEDTVEAQSPGSGYGYADDAKELLVAIKYHDQIRHRLDCSPSESGRLYEYLESHLAGLLARGVPTLLNFGVSYAHIDSLLAAKFPACRFVGIDRSSFTQLYNRQCFDGILNMEFEAGDVFDLLNRRRFDGGIFFHTRTLCLLPKRFIEKLYTAVREAGFQYVAAVEQIGISRRTFKAYRFSEHDQPSDIFRSGMFIHNYPGLLKAAGYEPVSAELVQTNHPHRDYRFLSCVGRID